LSLSRAGHRIKQLIVRDRKIADKVSKLIGGDTVVQKWPSVDSIQSEIILICTGDPEIESAAAAVAGFVRPRQTVFHTSGSLTSQSLVVLGNAGCAIGSMHPLVSISDPFKGANRFSGSYFCVEGSKKAVSNGRALVRSMGGEPFTIATEKKSLYHASAVMVAGHVVALFDTGVQMLMNCGVSRKEAQKVLLPLTKSTLENLSHQTPFNALTGTFARLDVDGLSRHIDAFKDIPEELRDVYFMLAELSLSLMESNGTTDKRIEEMRRMIFMAKGKRR
jgi:predicted short-subunit dehydrogenase-like oxidoreductase (DUF2520 family)